MANRKASPPAPTQADLARRRKDERWQGAFFCALIGLSANPAITATMDEVLLVRRAEHTADCAVKTMSRRIGR